jgi:hypothetical protein
MSNVSGQLFCALAQISHSVTRGFDYTFNLCVSQDVSRIMKTINFEPKFKSFHRFDPSKQSIQESDIKSNRSRYCPLIVRTKGVHRFGLIFLLHKKTYQIFHVNTDLIYALLHILAPQYEFIKVPNRLVAVDAWKRSACYPRGSFYPLSCGLTNRIHRIT